MNKAELFAYIIIGTFVLVFTLITLFDPSAEWHRQKIKEVYCKVIERFIK